MIPRLTMALLCGIGLYVSAVMWRKGLRGARGELTEPSVVQTPRARALGGVPNAALGLIYYALLLACIAFWNVPGVAWAALAASAAAAALSAYLAYSLLFVTRMPCPYCWTSHVVNWLLLALSIATNLSNWFLLR